MVGRPPLCSVVGKFSEIMRSGQGWNWETTPKRATVMSTSTKMMKVRIGGEVLLLPLGWMGNEKKNGGILGDAYKEEIKEMLEMKTQLMVNDKVDKLAKWMDLHGWRRNG